MLWMTVGGLVLLLAGLLVVVKTKATLVGAIIALAGAAIAVTMFITVQKEDAKNAAKCASVTGSYGGDTCYIEGVEKDLKEIGL